MAEWISPVFDRTQADVDFAISKIARILPMCTI